MSAPQPAQKRRGLPSQIAQKRRSLGTPVPVRGSRPISSPHPAPTRSKPGRGSQLVRLEDTGNSKSSLVRRRRSAGKKKAACIAEDGLAKGTVRFTFLKEISFN